MLRQARTQQQKRFFWVLPVLVGILWFGSESAFAVGEISNQKGVQQDAPAQEILHRASDFLGGLPAFSVTIRSRYEAIQPDGERIEYGEIRNIMIRRPDRLRVDVRRSDGDHDQLLFDGRAITAVKPADKLFARVNFAGTVDTAIVYLVRDLQVHFPLARLLLTSAAGELGKLVEAVGYVEENRLYGTPVDHLAVRGPDVDAQLWIMQGEQPLPLRVVITYKNEPGQPQFRADFIDWNVSPETTGETFLFTPPDGSEEILFIAPVRPAEFPAAQKGGKQ